MKQTNLIVLFLLLGNLTFGQQIAAIETIKIDSKELNQEREILMYTPPGYKENVLVSYDVIYVFDAQNREFFDFTHSIINFISNTNKKYIVVGITSPYNEALDYARNNDMLPIIENDYWKQRYGKYSGNADNFLNYIKNEVLPYTESTYRTRGKRIAIGHSLSASFILYSMFKEPNLFKDYFAVSPNFAYDDERLVKDLLAFDFQKIKGKTFLYMSHANEGINYWKKWIPARNKVYSFFQNSNHLDNINFVVQKFPDESHNSSFAPSLSDGLHEYFKYLETQKTEFSKEIFEVTLRVKVPSKKDEVYITGNQPQVGDWDPGLVKMSHTSDFEREIKVKIHAPLELKFTRGTWETEGEIKHNDGFNNLCIDPKKTSNIELEIIEWADKM